MSKLTIVDLPKVEEISSSEMAKVAGGMDCIVAQQVSDNCRGLSIMLENMGFHDAAVSAENTSLMVGDGCDHADSP